MSTGKLSRKARTVLEKWQRETSGTF